MSSPLVQGRIVWTAVRDADGNEKSRPAVILTATAEIDPAGEVIVAAVTTQLGRARFSESVALPPDPAGHPQTGLKKPSEVVCTWLAAVPVAALTPTAGAVPPDLLAEILAKVDRLT
ncbi:MAG: type II toxin-antitoxin system PemK/MazF family toxin [Gemmataceae bacterium]|nr:type II toxin-antitoxin system PemK/MazF family toxin [Gemmataceae bacterium]